MGLDCVWKKEQGLDDPNFDPPLKLAMSEIYCQAGQGSFRGKLYNSWIKHVSEFSLYSHLDAAEVKQVATALERRDIKGQVLWICPDTGYQVTKRELWDIRRMFRAYADINARLLAWYF